MLATHTLYHTCKPKIWIQWRQRIAPSAYEEHGAQHVLFILGHFKLPQQRYWKDDDYELGGNIDGFHYCLCGWVVDTFSGDLRHPQFLDWRALKNADKDLGELIRDQEESKAYQDLFEPFLRENPIEKKEYR